MSAVGSSVARPFTLTALSAQLPELAEVHLLHEIIILKVVFGDPLKGTLLNPNSHIRAARK